MNILDLLDNDGIDYTALAIEDYKRNMFALLGKPGFEEERAALSKISTSVSLGRRILRAETAAIVCSALILSKLGEM